MNRDTVVVLTPVSGLFVSTQRDGNHAFRCAIIEGTFPEGDYLNCRIVSEGFEGETCLAAQTDAYDYAKRVYPTFADQMKRPPYLIWSGPSVAS